MADEVCQRTVCVTGASGFLASWLVKRLLENGYYVRGTVRNPDDALKTSHLRELPGASERLKLFKAELLNQGAFDDIVEGCQGVFHTASAVFFTANDPQQEIVEPAVQGTLNVLRACKKSSTVKRVIYTSSTSTVRHSTSLTPDSVLDESVWSSTDFCREKQLWYPLSKTLAEQAAWDFAESNSLNLVTVQPSFIVGRVLPQIASASAADCLALFEGKSNHFKMFTLMGYVHLDDVASAHIYLMENPSASGRFICSSVDATNVEITEFLAARFPEYKIPTNFENVPRAYKGYSSKKLEDAGFQFKCNRLEEMFDDFVSSLKSSGRL